MVGRWLKGVFLAIIGVFLLIYAEQLVDDLQSVVERSGSEVVFEGTWDLLTLLLWILVAWLFVDAALTIVLSFTERRYTIEDVMKRLDRIQKKLGIYEPRPKPRVVEQEEGEPEEVSEEQPEEVPPPPRE
jgi:hypothetical protein